MSHRLSIVSVAMLIAVSVTACRQEEQGRPLDLQPGVYQGEKLAPLSGPQLKDLRQRGEQQGG